MAAGTCLTHHLGSRDCDSVVLPPSASLLLCDTCFRSWGPSLLSLTLLSPPYRHVALNSIYDPEWLRTPSSSPHTWETTLLTHNTFSCIGVYPARSSGLSRGRGRQRAPRSTLLL